MQHTKDGLKIMGACVKPVGNDKNELDCNNFATQAEAQAKYDQCTDEIASYNDGVDAKKVKSLDLYGLDRDKDGVVCEALSNTQTPSENFYTLGVFISLYLLYGRPQESSGIAQGWSNKCS